MGGVYIVSKRNKDCIITRTHNKIMIRDAELGRVLNKTELQQFNDIVNKITNFDYIESKRKGE